MNSVPASSRVRRRQWATSEISALVSAITAFVAIGFTALTVRATQHQVDLIQQGQITDRYTKAVDQLGTDGAGSMERRIGGIYALERIARDSPDDQPTIIEVLSAFVRNHAHHTTETPCAPAPATDVQAALTVLSRRKQFIGDAAPDLSSTCLKGANLANANLVNADLTSADLTYASLGSANLAAANLTYANLAYVNLANANLMSTNFTFADLGDADLAGADANNADLAYANLFKANLSSANLANVRLTNAKLVSANLAWANLRNADLSSANLANANLTNVDLANAVLTDADLSGVIR